MKKKGKEYLSTREVAERLGVSESTLKYWLARCPEIKEIAKIEEKLFRIYYRWPPDAPEKIRRIIRKKRSGGF